MKTTDSGHGGSSVGSHSPPNPDTTPIGVGQRQAFLPPNAGPPPRHLLPAKLKPSPPVKLHPPGFVILDLKGKCQLTSLKTTSLKFNPNVHTCACSQNWALFGSHLNWILAGGYSSIVKLMFTEHHWPLAMRLPHVKKEGRTSNFAASWKGHRIYGKLSLSSSVTSASLVSWHTHTWIWIGQVALARCVWLIFLTRKAKEDSFN